MTTKFLMTAAAAVVMVTASSPSWALFGDDEARKAILELREKTQTLQNAQMQLVGQIEALREQNAQLTGRVEKLTNDLTLQQRSVRDLFGNLDKRVAALEPQMESIDGKNEMVSPEERALCAGKLHRKPQGAAAGGEGIPAGCARCGGETFDGVLLHGIKPQKGSG